jgi:hypothetical protein
VIVSEKTYHSVAAGAEHVTRWQAKKVRVEILNPLTVLKDGGEIQEREGTFEAFKCAAHDRDGNVRAVGCPAPVDTVKPLRYRDKNGKTCGRLQVISIATRPYVSDDGRPMWEITWARAGTSKRPVPDTEPGIYLAHEHGYTSSRSRALDPDAPVFVDDTVLAVMADDRAFTKDQRRRRLLEIKRRTEIVSARIEQELAELDLSDAA